MSCVVGFYFLRVTWIRCRAAGHSGKTFFSGLSWNPLWQWDTEVSLKLQICSLFILNMQSSVSLVNGEVCVCVRGGVCAWGGSHFFFFFANLAFFLHLKSWFCIFLPFLYQKPLILSCFSILHGTPAFQRVLLFSPLLLPRRSAGQVWERDCPSEVGCYQQGAACIQFRSALATEGDFKASHNASCDPSKHAC